MLMEAWLRRSLACKHAERWTEAFDAFEKYTELRTAEECAHRQHHIALANHFFRFDCVPAIYRSETEIEETRDHVVRSLEAIHSEINAVEATEGTIASQLVIDSLFSSTGFYIAYQQKNDADLMRSYSSALRKISQMNAQVTQRQKSVQILWHCSNVSDHNGARWAYDWLQKLPSDDYGSSRYAFHGRTMG